MLEIGRARDVLKRCALPTNKIMAKLMRQVESQSRVSFVVMGKRGKSNRVGQKLSRNARRPRSTRSGVFYSGGVWRRHCSVNMRVMCEPSSWGQARGTSR
ncbi:hypothetical protein RSOLAG22IIIB_06105 [Rhizoctonia solani]|uniref:Uncharacterized protein n=1 Tax=Rhizoctonia solani TaxID=456999 RepID=A0A0K6GBX4_9AGAM|nr:hypothetical protein RSOLAG22IIIB_06105 [Rhizoctonia solani]